MQNMEVSNLNYVGLILLISYKIMTDRAFSSYYKKKKWYMNLQNEKCASCIKESVSK